MTFAGIPRRLREAPLDVLGQLWDSSNTTLLVALGEHEGSDRRDASWEAVASQASLPAQPDGSSDCSHAIYKPVAGERPLWDFPDGHLAHREVATWIVATAGGWEVVPPTVLRDGPFGRGSVQRWVTEVPGEAERVTFDDDHNDNDNDNDDGDDLGWDETARGSDETADCVERPDVESDEESGEESGDGSVEAAEREPADLYDVDTQVEHSDRFVDLFEPAQLPPGWLPVLSGQLSTGGVVVVAHADRADLRSVAVLDAVLNNSDRKGSHLLLGLDGRLWCIDHGLTLHREDKLRTVLWGWAGRPIPEPDLARLERLREQLEPDGDLTTELAPLLTRAEIHALRRRVATLLSTGLHPHPSPDWPSVPWPAL